MINLNKKTHISLGLVSSLIVGAISVLLWAQSEHDSIKAEVTDTLRAEQTKEVEEIKGEIEEVQEQVKEVNGKIDTNYREQKQDMEQILQILLEIKNGDG